MPNYFHENDKNFGPLFDAIRAACEGLMYISETDAPVIPFLGKACKEVTAKELLEQTGKDINEQVEERTFEEFFERLTADRDWYGEAEKARAKKFLELQKLLEESVTDRKVFRIGQIRLDIYVVGLDDADRLTGVATFAVET